MKRQVGGRRCTGNSAGSVASGTGKRKGEKAGLGIKGPSHYAGEPSLGLASWGKGCEPPREELDG